MSKADRYKTKFIKTLNYWTRRELEDLLSGNRDEYIDMAKIYNDPKITSVKVLDKDGFRYVILNSQYKISTLTCMFIY